jgi:hypothetical protein
MDTIPLPLDSVRMTRTYWDRALRDHQKEGDQLSLRGKPVVLAPGGTAVQTTAMESDRSKTEAARLCAALLDQFGTTVKPPPSPFRPSLISAGEFLGALGLEPPIVRRPQVRPQLRANRTRTNVRERDENR